MALRWLILQVVCFMAVKRNCGIMAAPCHSSQALAPLPSPS